MAELEQQLLDIKEEIEDSQKEKSILEGQLKELINILKQDWDCNNIEKAKNLIKQLQEKIEMKKNKLEEIIAELRNYGWDI